MSDSVRVKLLKTKKIDVRLDQELFDLVDNYAQASRLSRAQVVERALLQSFGRPVADNPIPQGNVAPQSSASNLFKPSETSDGGSSTANRPNSRKAG